MGEKKSPEARAVSSEFSNIRLPGLVQIFERSSLSSLIAY